MPEVTRIFKKANLQEASQSEVITKKIRVAAYCRVSTDTEIQENSLQTQTKVFRQRISEHEGWILSGIYADDGISGTDANNRKEFQRMIRDCQEGKIDYIITKSISRFARNTIDCIETVRKFKKMGVYVLFEKENIDTANEVSEMILTIMAAFAQEESRSISENLKWGLRKRYEMGVTRWKDIYGYRKAEDGSWLIQEDEAKIVREIFYDFEHGKDGEQISRMLKSRKDTALANRGWDGNVLRTMLKNEKYMGDALLQKFCSIDFLKHKSIRNDSTEIPSYYVKDHHVPIISKKTFERVQKIFKMKEHYGGESMQYPYGCSELLCPYCGEKLIRRHMNIHRKPFIWTCHSEKGCKKYAIKVCHLDDAVLKACRERGDLPVPETVEFWWLDEYIQTIIPRDEKYIEVTWKDGKITRGKLAIEKKEDEPRFLAEDYNLCLQEICEGKRIITSPQTPEERKRMRQGYER